jgi:aminomethyltransferase
MSMTATIPAVDDGYHIIRNECALVDHNTTTIVRVSGPGSTALLSRACSRSVDFLLEGQILSALLINESGDLVAELLVYCQGGTFLLEVDADRAAASIDLLRAGTADDPDVVVEEVVDVRVIGLEGPLSPAIAQQYLSLRVDSMAYPSFVIETYEGQPLLVSRTGISGEYGFKFHVPAAAAEGFVAGLLAAGAVQVDADALEVCRLEMRFPNLTREAPEPDATPFTVGLQWMVDFGHEFPGKLALLNRIQNEQSSSLVCWRMDAATDVPDAGTALCASETPVGRVRHALYSPGLDCVIGVADVDRAIAVSGLELSLAGSDVEVRTVSAPFRKATSLGRPMIKPAAGARPGDGV